MELFDWALSRQADPPTSEESATVIKPKLSYLRAFFVDSLTKLGRATANEVAAFATDNPHLAESIRKRAGECEKLGLVEKCGVRPCSRTGNNATVYRIKTQSVGTAPLEADKS